MYWRSSGERLTQLVWVETTEMQVFGVTVVTFLVGGCCTATFVHVRVLCHNLTDKSGFIIWDIQYDYRTSTLLMGELTKLVVCL